MSRLGSDLPEPRKSAHRNLQRLAGNPDISTVGPATDELWTTLCTYLKEGLVLKSDFDPKDWQQILIHSGVMGYNINRCLDQVDTPSETPDVPSEDDIIPEEEEEIPQDDQPASNDDNEQEENIPMAEDDRLRSRVSEESEDDESWAESYDRNLLNNLKSIVDAFAVAFVAESFQDLRDYTEERRERVRAETRRLEHEDEERQLRLRQEQELFNQRMRHAEETFQDRRLAGQQAIRHADNAMGQHLRDQTRDNNPPA